MDNNQKMWRVVLILQCLVFTEAFISYPFSVALSKKCVGVIPFKQPSGMQVSHSPAVFKFLSIHYLMYFRVDSQL